MTSFFAHVLLLPCTPALVYSCSYHENKVHTGVILSFVHSSCCPETHSPGAKIQHFGWCKSCAHASSCIALFSFAFHDQIVNGQMVVRLFMFSYFSILLKVSHNAVPIANPYTYTNLAQSSSALPSRH